MAIKRMPISDFVDELERALNRHDGYIMGAKGQNPKDWSKKSWYFTQYKDRDNYTAKQEQKALYWREHAERVYDCNGLAEGIYEEWSGVNINTKARYNYAEWCGIKGVGTIPLVCRKPGVAVFWGSKTSSINHVAYLYKPVKANNPAGDWYLIEARGVMYGVVKTKLSSRKPQYWGVMDKYFDYGEINYKIKPLELGDRTLKSGMKGDDVEALQEALMSLGYDLGSSGADGDFGSATKKAVKLFQKNAKISADGKYGPLSHIMLKAAIQKTKTTGKMLRITGNCNVRSEARASSKKLGSVKKNRKLPCVDEVNVNGWYRVLYNGKNGWVYGKYIEI